MRFAAQFLFFLSFFFVVFLLITFFSTFPHSPILFFSSHSFFHLQNKKHQEVRVGHTSKLLEQVARQKRDYVVLGCDDVVVLLGEERERESKLVCE